MLEDLKDQFGSCGICDFHVLHFRRLAISALKVPQPQKRSATNFL
jgi:hypothetical protein